MSDLNAATSANIERFEGGAALYDRHRPQPPTVVVDILTQLIRCERPALVVDLGAGTGLSTRVWAGRAEQIIGIEPGEDMRRQAVETTSALLPDAPIRYQGGLSTDTGLPDGCADIVTCSQALHWMEPEPTFAEVARVLRPGGLFAAIDCDWPPTVHWEAEVAYRACFARVEPLAQTHGIAPPAGRWWAKHEHLARMSASGRFRYLKEIVLHHQEMGNAERFVGVAMSQASLAQLLRQGVSEAELGLDTLRAVAERTLGAEPLPWYWSYRVRVGVV